MTLKLLHLACYAFAGVQLVFVGKPDLGIAGNRAEGGNVWTNGARNVRFWRDGATIKASNGANTVSYALPSSNTCTPDKYNFLRVSVRQNSDTAAISVSNILVSGTPYAGPTAVTNTLVNADYVHVGQLSSFDITATVNIGARAGCTNENCRVEFQVGCHKGTYCLHTGCSFGAVVVVSWLFGAMQFAPLPTMISLSKLATAPLGRSMKAAPRRWHPTRTASASAWKRRPRRALATTVPCRAPPKCCMSARSHRHLHCFIIVP